MKFLIDNALSPLISDILKDNGYDSLHVREINLQSADDETIFFYAKEHDRVIVSADTDFGTLLSIWKYSKPSFILFRKINTRKPRELASLLIINLKQIQDELETGHVIVFDQNRIRLRKLPILRNN